MNIYLKKNDSGNDVTDADLFQYCRDFNCNPTELEVYLAIESYHEMKSPIATHDADTILADVMEECEYCVNDLSEEIFGIWKNSSDKTSVEALFYSLAGIEFREYLDKVLRETTKKNIRNVKVKITDIHWDIDKGDDIKLPREITHEFIYDDDEDELLDKISDWLSDVTGYCHNGFRYEIDEEVEENDAGSI